MHSTKAGQWREDGGGSGSLCNAEKRLVNLSFYRERWLACDCAGLGSLTFSSCVAADTSSGGEDGLPQQAGERQRQLQARAGVILTRRRERGGGDVVACCGSSSKLSAPQLSWFSWKLIFDRYSLKI